MPAAPLSGQKISIKIPITTSRPTRKMNPTVPPMNLSMCFLPRLAFLVNAPASRSFQRKATSWGRVNFDQTFGHDHGGSGIALVTCLCLRLEIRHRRRISTPLIGCSEAVDFRGDAGERRQHFGRCMPEWGCAEPVVSWAASRKGSHSRPKMTR